MQYVGQTGRSLKTRFREHFRKMKKPKKFDTFLYRHFKNNGHSPSKIVIQPVEKIISCFLNKGVPMAVLRHQICNIAVKH